LPTDVMNIDFMQMLPTIGGHAVFLIFIYCAARFVSRAVNTVVTTHIIGEENSISLLQTILNAVIYIMAGLIVLSHFNISIAPILTAISVGGVAVALGLQETLQNIFSGVWLILAKQFRVGDFILLTTKEQGKITDITWRYTTVQSLMGNLIVIPNKNLASSVVTNYNLPEKDITIKIPIGVGYNSDLEQVERVTLEVANQVMHDMDEYSDKPPRVVFHTFGESSINFDLLIHSARFEMQLELKHRFIKALTARYRQEGIDIPYPIRTIIQNSQ